MAALHALVLKWKATRKCALPKNQEL
ncbi:UNVERIFIED_CONTAM: hypothetical protein GTU68_040755 [Idotea baltica]|nr:hypothetical protein [Idotea baltica]